MVEDRHTRLALSRCHRVVAGSTWMAHYLAATGTPADRVRLVEPPIAVIGAPRGATGAADAPTGDPPLVTFVGRLVTIKGADHALRASARLDVDHRLAIAGDGVDRPALERLAADLGIIGRVEFLGRLGPDELEALRRRSAVVLVPALSPEVFGMVGAEALAVGVPVVGYAVGGTTDWLAAGGPLASGVAVGDIDGLVTRLRHVLQQPPADRERALVAATMRETLSPGRHAARLAEVYGEARELFADPPGRSVVRLPSGPMARRRTAAQTRP
jgi:glycosyltransferase involved in cell wall biosynthesis